MALSGAPRPATALSGRAVARFSESKLFEIAMTLLRLEKRTFYRSGGDVIMSSRWLYLFQDNSSTLPVHPEVLLHSTDPPKVWHNVTFQFTDAICDMERCPYMAGCTAFDFWTQESCGRMHDTHEKKCLIFYQFVLFPAIYGCLLKLSFCQRIHGPWKIETYIILTILMVMMSCLSFAWNYPVRCVIALYCYW